MPKQIVIAEQHRIAAVFSEDQIQELIVATGTHQVGDIYVGTVENVLPGIDAAFINIGDSERNGFMHVSDLGPLRLKRAAGSITELVTPQQKVLVQIMKEPTGNKGPRLTGNITLPGRYLVLMPFGRGVNLSRRIRNDSERNRLRALAILVKPAGMGLLVRTEAEGVAEEAIIEDLETLQKQWETIQQEALSTRPPSLLNRDDDFVQRVLRDVYSADVNRIVTDIGGAAKRVKHHLANWNGGRMPPGVLVDQHRERVPLLEYFRVNAAIREALKPRVDLPSGGYIIIEPTEALTVIDVNSGSFTRSATSRETVLWTNCEAATEIARQLRLRNIAGVIIVDFIDMDSRRDQLQVLEQFNKELRADKARPQIAQLSELGLVELTRKRQGQNLYELFGRPCATCGGLGHLIHLPDQPGDGVDSLVDTPIPTATTAVKAQPTLKEARSEESDPLQDLQELDLVNHPNYQERSSSKPNRRRRRRDPMPSRSNGKVDSGRDPDASGQSSSPDATDDDKEKEKEKATPNRSRSRGNGRSDKRGEAPQVISVEMTPDEQRIYAMMGISPVVLANEPVKDPRNTVVSVVMPGESTTGTQAGPTTAEASSPAATPEEAEATATVGQENAVAVGGSSSATEVAQDKADKGETASTEGDSKNTVRRRRRRRSSSTQEEATSASS
ncbi:Ribonuclease E/G-like protein [Halomicronema hongdechloris C2206]|uniref:Ribonuclease E/G-like protein n=1 Tax=Halomicronema hongdechloris C2206 TaxID=1641165 RepID=A0A1Z3HI58_9CYAN|nr:Rne/Rng family ribonuclease [Halomicronema hongdechloris]ASC69968.1 Ribonuclease E/G-like protein [Halomicronema hongdechloris C2206]